jgi:hypothetical protein
VVIATDSYPKGAGFNSRVMHGFFSHDKEVENIDLLKKAKHVESRKSGGLDLLLLLWPVLLTTAKL